MEPTTTRTALARTLGIERVVLEIQDPSFPCDDDEDLGRGTPYSRASRRFFAWLARQGFDGVQLGPQGEISEHNASPYDGSLFQKTHLSLSASDLVARGLVRADTVARLAAERPRTSSDAEPRAHHRYAWRATDHLVDIALAHERWRTGIAEVDRDVFIQGLLSAQHAALRADLRGFRLYGDLQVGMSPDDALTITDLVLHDHRMGAPPSRTNPPGQAWGYPVFDPARSDAVVPFFRARIRRMLAAYDGIRIDHPHGLVCPWVYRTGEDVAAGARLRESPERPDLARYALVAPDDLDASLPAYAEHRVRHLTDAQIDRYAWLVDVLAEEARAVGLGASDIPCEVLSTLPYPLESVMARHGLGRFRVVQKLALADPTDVYRLEHARPEDWVMLGNHDTPSIWALADQWQADGSVAGWARYVADLLRPDPIERAALVAAIVADRSSSALVHALFAAMLASPARHVLVFFPDLFGQRARYNLPGTFSDANWSLRVPRDWETAPHALDIARCVAVATRAT